MNQPGTTWGVCADLHPERRPHLTGRAHASTPSPRCKPGEAQCPRQTSRERHPRHDSLHLFTLPRPWRPRN